MARRKSRVSIELGVQVNSIILFQGVYIELPSIDIHVAQVFPRRFANQFGAELPDQLSLVTPTDWSRRARWTRDT
ncbi:hypothetical protein PIB30_056679 [Stylosanthes scabra]|uniref:Uncharacterized protein n=1 Tax=Stylosanthes scabra TaxID=79078 RepID=A0ABU6YK23_9FABA|nr:hypothetical protein [Stylosanthes scabra]